MKNPEKLIERIYEDLAGLLEKGFNFFTEEAPGFASEIVNYGLVSEGIWALFWGVMWIILAILIFLSLSFYKRKGTDEAGALGILFGLIILPTTGALVEYVANFVTIIVAPRIYILEFLKDRL